MCIVHRYQLCLHSPEKEGYAHIGDLLFYIFCSFINKKEDNSSVTLIPKEKFSYYNDILYIRAKMI